MTINKKFISHFINVSSKAALAASYLIGKKDKIKADQAAVGALCGARGKQEGSALTEGPKAARWPVHVWSRGILLICCTRLRWTHCPLPRGLGRVPHDPLCPPLPSSGTAGW